MNLEEKYLNEGKKEYGFPVITNKITQMKTKRDLDAFKVKVTKNPKWYDLDDKEQQKIIKMFAIHKQGLKR